MQLSDIRARLQRYVNEVSPSVGVGTTADLNNTINDAYNDVRNLIEGENPYWFAAKTSLNYTASAESVALPSAAQTNRILKVADTTDSATYPRELQFVSGADQYFYNQVPSMWYLVTSGGVVAPDFYSLAGQNLQLFPKPSGQRSLDIWYVPDATVLANDADTPTDIPTRFHELIALRAALRVLAYDRRESVALEGIADRQEQKLLSLVSDRATGQGTFVRFIDINRS